jgi:membrane protease YdiL (CAAX protease family)
LQISTRAQLCIELLAIAVFAALYLGLLRTRTDYLDAALGVTAVVLIGASAGRTRRLWNELPAVPLSYRERQRHAFARVAVFTAAGVLLFLVIAVYLGYAQAGWPGAAARVLNPHLLPALALYLLWGLLQQYVFEFYLLGRLLYLFSPPVAIALTAIVFSAVHFPRFIVMAAVAAAALVWATLYRRYRALLPLAMSHAILASTLHYWVFARDLWADWIAR